MDQGIKKAVEAKGTIAALARDLGITRAAIHQWDRIPADRVVEVERVTGVPREELRPDLYRSSVPSIAPQDTPSEEQVR